MENGNHIMTDKNLPIGFILDADGVLPEGYFLDGDTTSEIPDAIIQSDETLLSLLEWHKNGGEMPHITILDEYQARVLRVITEAQGKTGIYQGALGPVGPKGSLGDRGPMGPLGPLGDKGLTGDKGDMGSRGRIGPTGIHGPDGPKGEIGPDGPQGEEGPPLEWEFCDTEGIEGGGIRLRKPNGDWSMCKRIVGKSGTQGNDGEPGIAERAYGAGGGGGAGDVDVQNLLPNLHKIIAPGETGIVGALSEQTLLAAKWFLSIIEDVTENNHAVEIYSRRKGNEVTWNKSSVLGDKVRYGLNIKIKDGLYILEITNNESNDIKVDGVVIPIKR